MQNVLRCQWRLYKVGVILPPLLVAGLYALGAVISLGTGTYMADGSSMGVMIAGAVAPVLLFLMVGSNLWYHMRMAVQMGVRRRDSFFAELATAGVQLLLMLVVLWGFSTLELAAKGTLDMQARVQVLATQAAVGMLCVALGTLYGAVLLRFGLKGMYAVLFVWCGAVFVGSMGSALSRRFPWIAQTGKAVMDWLAALQPAACAGLMALAAVAITWLVWFFLLRRFPAEN